MKAPAVWPDGPKTPTRGMKMTEAGQSVEVQAFHSAWRSQVSILDPALLYMADCLVFGDLETSLPSLSPDLNVQKVARDL